MIIQIIGLPGAGKTALATALADRINAIHFNAAAEAELNPFGTVIKQYGLAITTGGDGKTFVGGSDGNEYFLYATADPTKPGSTVLTPTRDYDVAGMYRTT